MSRVYPFVDDRKRTRAADCVVRAGQALYDDDRVRFSCRRGNARDAGGSADRLGVAACVRLHHRYR
jgi:gluconate kinase